MQQDHEQHQCLAVSCLSIAFGGDAADVYSPGLLLGPEALAMTPNVDSSSLGCVQCQS